MLRISILSILSSLFSYSNWTLGVCPSPLNKHRRTIVIAENQITVKVDFFPIFLFQEKVIFRSGPEQNLIS